MERAPRSPGSASASPRPSGCARLPADNVADLLENGLYGLMTPTLRRLRAGQRDDDRRDHRAGLRLPVHGLGAHAVDRPHVAAGAVPAGDARRSSGATRTRWRRRSSIPSGDVVPVDGGYRWTGRGFFSSGVDHCNWLTAAVPIKREGVEGPPERRWLLIPREDFEIVDDWYHRRPEGHRAARPSSSTTSSFPSVARWRNTALEDGTAPGRQIHAHPMYGAISSANFTAAMAAPAVGAARGFLRRLRGAAALEVQHDRRRPDGQHGALRAGRRRRSMRCTR